MLGPAFKLGVHMMDASSFGHKGEILVAILVILFAIIVVLFALLLFTP